MYYDDDYKYPTRIYNIHIYVTRTYPENAFPN